LEIEKGLFSDAAPYTKAKRSWSPPMHADGDPLMQLELLILL